MISWWRHQMETFSALLALFSGTSPAIGEFPSQRPVTRSCDAVFDLRLNRQLSKQSWGWWFETPSGSLWRHCNDTGCCLPGDTGVQSICIHDIDFSLAGIISVLSAYWYKTYLWKKLYHSKMESSKLVGNKNPVMHLWLTCESKS